MKLRTKISILVILLMTITVVVVSYLACVYETRTKITEVENRLVKIATIIGTLRLTKDQPGQVCYQEYIDNLCRLNFSSGDCSINILYIALFDKLNKPDVYTINFDLLELKDKDGQLIKRASPKLIDSLIKQIENKEIATGGDIDTVSFQVDTNGKTKTLLKMGYSRKLLKKGIFEIWARNILVLICIIIMGIILSFVFAKRLTKPIERLSLAMKKVSEGDLTQKVEVSSQDEIGLLTQGFNLMTEGLCERDRIKDTFQRYVAKQVADKILHKVLKEKQSGIFEGESREVTILFGDIRGFTSLAEKLPPEEVIELLNEYFKIMIDVVFKYEGTLDKFIGDEVMALFGAPLDQQHPALIAVKTALEMQAELKNFNQKRRQEGKNEIYMGIGINTGKVVAGSIGSEKRVEYTVIGDSVNLASRIQHAAEKEQILIGEATYEYIKDAVDVEPLLAVMIKGKDQPVNLFRVKGLKIKKEEVEKE